MSSLCISSRDLKREQSNKNQSQQGTKEAVKIYRHECHLPEVQTVLGWFYHLLNGFHREFDKDKREAARLQGIKSGPRKRYQKGNILSN